MMKFKIGDKIKLMPPEGKKFVYGSAMHTGFIGGINASMYCTVATNSEFTVKSIIDKESISIVEDGGTYSWDAKWFVLVNKKKEIKEIEFIIQDGITKAIYGNNVGKAELNPKDINDERIGMIISLMRAMKFSKKEVEGVIDVLYDDVQIDLSQLTHKELIDEIWTRFN